MVYKGYEGLTQAQIKEEIVVEFYTKGTANGKKQPKMEFKKHIGFAVSKMYGFDDGTATDLGEDLFQIVFEELWKYTPEKFCNTFFKDSGEFNSSRFFGTIGNILNWKGLSSTSGMISKMLKCSSLDSANVSFNVDERDGENYSGLAENLTIVEEEYQEPDVLPIEEILSYLSEDELEVYKLRITKKDQRKSEVSHYQYVKLYDKLKRIKMFFDGETTSIDAVVFKPLKEKKPYVIKLKSPKVVREKQVQEFKSFRGRGKDLIPRLPRTKETEPRFVNLYRTMHYVNGKGVKLSAQETINIVEAELSTLIGNTPLHTIAFTALNLLHEERQLTLDSRKCSIFINSHKHTKTEEELAKVAAERKIILNRKNEIIIELRKLNNDRKRIILSDATNGGNI